MEDIFDKDFLNSIGFEVVKDDGQYGEAHSKRAKGMTVINWNREGASCTYFGDKLEKNSFVGIKKDGGTRTVFNGYVFDRSQLELIIRLTM
jgi:hypothetical protein